MTSTAISDTAPLTIIKRCGVYGSRNLPAVPAVTAKPTIIITHTSAAAPARRGASTRLASSVSSDVPAALTPRPTSMNASTASARPAVRELSPIHAVATAPRKPPVASTTRPPMIHGVRRAPTSEPKPMRGREICTA